MCKHDFDFYVPFYVLISFIPFFYFSILIYNCDLSYGDPINMMTHTCEWDFVSIWQIIQCFNCVSWSRVLIIFFNMFLIFVLLCYVYYVCLYVSHISYIVLLYMSPCLLFESFLFSFYYVMFIMYVFIFLIYFKIIN